jgi:carbonic anhydrase
MHFILAVLLAASGVSVDATCPPPWGYVPPDSEEHWGRIAPLCVDGERQSPIVLSSGQSAPRNLAITWGPMGVPVRAYNTAREIKFSEGTSRNFIRIDGQTAAWYLKEFHWHTPAEHSFGSSPARAMELHFVHTRGNESAVVAVTVIEGPFNANFNEMLLLSPSACATRGTDLSRINLAQLLPEIRTYYAYDGSLTTPNCDEGLRWFVMAEPITVRSDQLQNLRSLTFPNARKPQNRNGREITVRQ